MTRFHARSILIALLGAVLAWPVAARQQAGLEVALRQAIETETVAGDLRSAIEQYKKVAEGPDRALAARALLRMAGCYEKLGEAQARTIYTRIVSQYSDQRTQVAEAQARLVALAPAQQEPVQTAMNLVPLPSPGNAVPPSVYLGGDRGDYRLSPDGRYGLIADFQDQFLNLGLFEYETRNVTWVTNFSDQNRQSAYPLIVSPDGSRVAYGVVTVPPSENGSEIRVAEIGQEARVVHRSASNRPDWLAGWTPADELIGVREQPGGWHMIFKVDVATGRFSQIATILDDSWNAFSSPVVAPDGRTLAFVRRIDGNFEVYCAFEDGSKWKMSRITDHPANDGRLERRGGLLWSRDGRHLLFVSDRYDRPSLWAVRVENGEQVGAPFLIQTNFTGTDLAWVGDRFSFLDRSSKSGVLTARLDASGGDRGSVLSPVAYSGGAESQPRWSRHGDVAFQSQGGQQATLVIQRPDGQTRERQLPAEWGRSSAVTGFNIEGTAVAVYRSNLHERLALYDLETDNWSMIDVPAVAEGWRKRLGYAVVQGGPDDYVIYHPVTKLDPATRDYGPFEIHRLDATGQDTTVYKSAETLGAGGRPLWLSADGTALRFVEGRTYRELDLKTATTVDLLAIGDDFASGWDHAGPVTSADGRTVAIRLSADRAGATSDRLVRTFRVVDLDAGTSQDVTVPLEDVSTLLGPAPAGIDLSIRVEQFRLSATGDRLIFGVAANSATRRYVTEDPLEKFLRETGGR